jgi:Retroviral aspartyl protease
VKKLNDTEKEYLRKNDGCFNCRKIKVGHISPDCPERQKLKAVKKESVSALAVEVESDPGSEYSCPKSMPTITVSTKVGTTVLPSSLVDPGAMINVISQDVVAEHNIPTHAMPPMLIREPVNRQTTRADKKVVSTVEIPAENWRSQGPTEFIVAPLKEHDTILDMPFLADERILVDPAHSKIILPAAEGPPAHIREEELEGLAGI